MRRWQFQGFYGNGNENETKREREKKKYIKINIYKTR